MKAIVFQYSMPRFAFAKVFGAITPSAYLSDLGPTRLQEIPEPTLLFDDWVTVRSRVTGVCGSDSKQVYLDADFDNPITALISFPGVLGHEVVGIIEKVGPSVKALQVGERVVLNPWLSCGPRGIQPPCDACQRGHYYHCNNFLVGRLPPGIHHGNCRMVTGGFASHFPAHESQLFPIPDEVSNDTAVLADPFSVSLHAILKAPPRDGDLAVVYGCGTLGTLTIAILHALYPKASIIAIARHALQEKLALEQGAEMVIRAHTSTEIVQAIAEKTGATLHKPNFGMPWLLRGVDVIYDTVGSAETLEVGLRISNPRANIVITGVDHPKRFEWTPHYFKEINLIGSNAFGVEEFEGERLHAFEIFFKLLIEKRISIPNMITHRFHLEEYKKALLIAHQKDRHKAVKVVFDF